MYLQDEKISTVKMAIEAELPHFQVRSVKIIPHGWDNIVAEINHEYIFRFPRNAGYQSDKELHILKLLNKKISLRIPKVQFIGQKIKFMAYQKIPGIYLTLKFYQSFSNKQKKRLIKDLAQFLAELHAAISPRQAKKMGVKIELPHRNDRKTLGILARLKHKKVNEFARQTLLEIQKLQKEYSKIALLHDDLHLENFVINPKTKKISGVFDFGDISLGDINLEFYPLFFNAPWLVKEVMAEYEKMTKQKLSVARIILYAKANLCRDLAHFIEQENRPLIQKHIKLVLDWDKRLRRFT